MTIPAYLPYYVLLGSAGIIATLLYGLSRALAKADWTPVERARAVRLSGVVLIGWFVAATGLALAGVYQAAADRIPVIQFGIAVPILIGAMAHLAVGSREARD